MLFPVLFAIPYVQRRTLLVVSVATAVAAVVAVLFAVRAVVPVVSGLPTPLIQSVFVFVAVAFLGLGLTVLYAYSGRLSEVVEVVVLAADCYLCLDQGDSRLVDWVDDLDR